MKKHVQIFLESRNRTGHEPMKCEWCFKRPIADVHHIERRGMGGSKTKDYPENLIGLCRQDHEDAEAGRITRDDLKVRVRLILEVVAKNPPVIFGKIPTGEHYERDSI